MTAADTPRPGMDVRMRFRKFDDSPHWCCDPVVLGTDAYGLWFGAGPGSVFQRPGVRVECPTWWVSLAPPDRRFVLTRYAEGESEHAEFYLDLTSVPKVAVQDGLVTITAIDLDLDVVRRFGEAEAWLDDEDEFAEHQRRWGYPAELITATEAEAAALLGEVSAGSEPFDQVSASWLQRCRELS